MAHLLLNRRALGVVAAALLTTSLVAQEPAPRPNVVLIVTDDQGIGDLGFTGNPILRTPHIDAMARRSARLERFYVCPVCAPTRAGLMTGRYHYRTGVVDTYISRALLDPAETTLAEILRDAGYTTGIFGKWHLGDNSPRRPMDQGFEVSLVHRGGGIGQPSDPPGGEGRYTDPILFRNGREVRMQGYCTDIYFEAALEHIEAAREAGRPSFTCITTNCPHGPFRDVPQESYAHYREKNLGNAGFPAVPGGHALPSQGGDLDRRARIFAMIENIDDNVGRLFERLDHLGITEQTLVIFLCDNGPNGRRYVAGFRGLKGHVHEGGIRSPFFAHWPARLRAGHTVTQAGAYIDVLPTIAAACGVAIPRGLHLDGRNLLPLLEGREASWPERTLFIQAHRGDRPVRYHHFAAIGSRWKLVHPSGFGAQHFKGPPRFELYDLERDPHERGNVAPLYPEVVDRMRGQYEAWFDDVVVPAPTADITVGTPDANPTVLTRQDWRHDRGRPWGAGSNGHWRLSVARAGRYRVLLRTPGEIAGQVVLSIGGRRHTREVDGGHLATFDLRLEATPLAILRAEIPVNGSSRGPLQVEVLRLPDDARKGPQRRPNIVLVMADDLGVEGLSCYGGESYATPHLDRMAAEGMRFGHCYSQPLCTPSRVKLMTGQSNLRNYVNFSVLAPDQTTFAHLLGRAGYRSAVVGKWQLLAAEHYDWAGTGSTPEQAGFDEHCLWQVDRVGSRFADPLIVQNGRYRRDTAGRYGPDVFADFAIDFLRRAQAGSQPFFLYYPMVLTHAPFEAPPGTREGSTREQRFAAMVSAMDGIVGRLRSEIADLGLAKDTLFLFTSDNGTDRRIRSQLQGREIRGGKGLPTDAGTRVPLLACWPGRVAPGTVSDALVDFSDFLPTLLHAAGSRPPADLILDGQSFLPALLGRGPGAREAIVIYSHPRPTRPGFPVHHFARDREWKLHADGRLFHVLSDPGEERPLGADHPGAPEARRRLERALRALPGEALRLGGR